MDTPDFRRIEVLGANTDFKIDTLGQVDSPRGVRLGATQSVHTGSRESHLVTDAKTALFRYSMRMPRQVELCVVGRPLRTCGPLGYATSGVEVEVRGSGEFTTAWCALGSDFLLKLSETDRGLKLGGIDLLHSIESPRLMYLGRAVFREAIEPGFCSPLFAEAAATWIVMEIARYNGARNIELKRSVRGGLAPWQLRRLDEYIRGHMSDALTLHELAMMLGISVRQLSRAVRQTKGMGLHRWICAYRIEEARRLLGESGLPVTEIAFRCGFQSAAAFSTAFRAAVGFTPTEYRRLGQ